MKEIAIIGSTGSIGTQAVAVAGLHKDRFRVGALCAFQNAERLFEQVRLLRPRMAGLVVTPKEIPRDVQFCEWVFGEGCLRVAATLPEADSVLVSVVGFAGLPSVLDALSAGKDVLLANKEALVAGGALVMDAVKKSGRKLLPVDSEHSAIFQCLEAANGNRPKRVILTASGGPFRNASAEDMERATVSQALSHPNWLMGRKITVDSASMMNKALEVIEARWLFDLLPDQIDVLIHPQSIVHSMVEFEDGAILSQMGVPDMRVPILYALTYPERLRTGTVPLQLKKMGALTFEEVDRRKFPGLSLAWQALHVGGTACAALNAANEVAVHAFLAERIPFGRIWRVSAEVLERIPNGSASSLQAVQEADLEARRMAERLIS